MKKLTLALIITAFSTGAAVAQECELPGMDPAEACPVGTLYNPESGACDTVMT